MKISKLAVTAALAVWCLTFVVAYSDCTVQDFVQRRCTSVSLGGSEIGKAFTPSADVLAKQSPDTAPNTAELKGQFGDFFGVLNALFGAFTLIVVYSAYEQQKQSSASTENANNTQLKNLAYQRFLNDVDSAMSAYSRLLHTIAIPERSSKDSSSNIWHATHGLFHIWASGMLAGGISMGGREDAARIYVGTYRTPGGSESNSENMWLPVRHLREGTQPDKRHFGWNTADWVVAQLAALSLAEQTQFGTTIRNQWRHCYEVHRYQFDALFRSWYHVCKTLESASSLGIDVETEWRVASRCRAQLSAIELTMLLCNQVLADGKGFPNAIAYSKRYAVFDNFAPGFDPIQHIVYRIATGGLPIEAIKSLPGECFNSSTAKAVWVATDTANSDKEQP
jgi:hypothetical protein